MFNDYRTILFMLGLLPSVIVNLSTSYSKDSAAPGRKIPGSEYQLESPLFDRHQDEEDASNLVMAGDNRYQLIGASSQRTNPRNLNKLFSKAWKNKRVAFEEQDPLYPKQKDVIPDKMVPMASNDDYRSSGHYFDSYGDWHHAGAANGGEHPVATATHGHGYSLAGLNLLNPLILVATLSFIISLINAVLGVVDKIRLPVVRARDRSVRVGGLSRLVDDGGFLDELEDLVGELHKGQQKEGSLN